MSAWVTADMGTSTRADTGLPAPPPVLGGQGHSSPAFDAIIEQARLERDGRRRLELFHEADRLAVAEDVAGIPIASLRNEAFVKPRVSGRWKYGKAGRRSPTSSSTSARRATRQPSNVARPTPSGRPGPAAGGP
jgi:hypothetical protein